MTKKGKEKKADKKSIILGIFIGLLIMILFGVTYIYYSFKQKVYVKDDYIKEDGEEYPKKEMGVNGYEEVDGIVNILLLGNDARSLDEKARADSIMILSIDNIHKNLKLISIMRDSYVEIPGHDEQKINHSFAFGGANLIRETIKQNFNININNYAIINFGGFQELTDIIGGLDIEITRAERNEMNKFIREVNPKDPHLIKKSGLQHLDGQQILSYCRIRKLGNGDYDRTKRQRKVISLIIDKVKDINVLKYPLLASKLFPYIKTNMDSEEILNSVYTIYKINNFIPEQMVIPVPEISKPQKIENKGCVIIMDKEQNGKIIHDFIFNNKKYKSYESYESYEEMD